MNDMQSTFRVGYLLQERYKIIRVLGQGVSGAVYLVSDEHSHQNLFILKEVMNVTREERGGLPFSTTVLKQLKHLALPHVHRIFYSDNHDRFYIVTDYIEGSNLEVIRQLMPGKRFSLHAAMTLMSPIMDAVSFLHGQHPPLIHGDIKPSNIIVPISGTTTSARLVDFGGVKELDIHGVAQQSLHNFRAPEQYTKRASRRSDVYALGAVFYTLLTGTVPIAASERLKRINAGEPDPLLPMNRFTPFAQVVANAIHRALSISRHNRFTSVEQLREALWRVMHEPMAMQLSKLAIVAPAGEHAQLEDNINETDSLELKKIVPFDVFAELVDESDDTVQEAKTLTLPGKRSVQIEAAPALSKPPLPSIVDGKDSPSAKVSSQDGVLMLRRKKRRLSINGKTQSRSSKRKARRTTILVCVLLLLCLLGSAVAAIGYQTYNAEYQKEVAVAQVGLKHLQVAASLMETWSKKPLDSSLITSARHEFTTASDVFAQLNSDLQSFSGIGTSIPVLSTRLKAAFRIVTVATKISLAGISGCNALSVIISRLHQPLGLGRGLTTADLTALGEDIHQIETDVHQATAQVNALQPEDLQLDARIEEAVFAFHHYLPSLQALLNEIDQLLPVLPSLLGVNTPAFYLVEILDPTNLRPGGGAIKDYGFATFIGGRLSAAHITDVNLLDTQSVATGHTLSLPPAYKWFDPTSTNWNLRDSNLDADFPTAANYAEQNYNSEGGRAALQGVVALTPTLIAQALTITGPIDVPELHKTVTSQNLIDLLHYYQLGPGKKGTVLLSPEGPPTVSRYFTELLAQHFLERIQQLPSSVYPKLIQLLIGSLHTKDLQIYFNAPAAESILQFSHVDATIPPSTDDNFFIVDTNLAADTANQFITSTLNDQVSLDSSGNATHHTSISYVWLKNGDVYGTPLYRDYARIYVPIGSSLQGQQGWLSGTPSQAFNREVWAGSFTLSYGQTRTITLTWIEKGIAKNDAAGWHYQYLIQRQAGSSWTLNVEVTLPACVVSHTSGGITSLGQTAVFSHSLAEDTKLGIDYIC